MNLVDAITQRLNINEATLIEKSNITEAEVIHWKKGYAISWEQKKQLCEMAGISEKFSLNWLFFADKNHVIERWISLIKEFVSASDYSSPELEDEAEDFASYVLEELMFLGCAIPNEPLSFDEYCQLGELEEIPAFYQVLRQYIAELGLMETWLLRYLNIYDDELSCIDDLAHVVYDVEQARYLFALRNIDEALLSEAGVCLVTFKELLATAESDVSRKLWKINEALVYLKIKPEQDLYSYLKFNSYELLDD